MKIEDIIENTEDITLCPFEIKAIASAIHKALWDEIEGMKAKDLCNCFSDSKERPKKIKGEYWMWCENCNKQYGDISGNRFATDLQNRLEEK